MAQAAKAPVSRSDEHGWKVWRYIHPVWQAVGIIIAAASGGWVGKAQYDQAVGSNAVLVRATVAYADSLRKSQLRARVAELEDQATSFDARLQGLEGGQEGIKRSVDDIVCLLRGQVSREPPEATLLRCGIRGLTPPAGR